MKKSIIMLTISLLCIIKANAQLTDSLKNQQPLKEEVNIAGKTGGEISKGELMNSKGLLLVGELASACYIKSYKMTLVAEGKEPNEYVSEKGGELTAAMRDAIKKAASGSRIYFEYINCVNKENVMRNLSPLKFVLN